MRSQVPRGEARALDEPLEDAGTVLVVDDDPANLLAIEAAFSETNHSLCKARSGREALRLLLQHDFALILLDVKMPDMDGFETARMIRSRARNRHVPIIFITAFNRNDEDILRGYELGAVDFLFKPIVPLVLRAKAQVFVELRRQAARLRELERRAQEQRLVEERQRWEADILRQEMERKDEFLAMLAHELRNPLAPIVMSLHIMQQFELGHPMLERARDAMDRQVRHLHRLVDDLLDISRISSGKITLRPAVVNLSEVIDLAVEASTPAIHERQHQLVVDVPTEPVHVRADRDRLLQVFSNLLSNSTRYTDPGGRIGVSCAVADDEIRVEITDNGLGISSEVLPHVFEVFVQERKAGKGLGLGLALVHRLVELHGGVVEAESAGPGLGSTFRVRLPRGNGEEPLPNSEIEELEPTRPLQVVLIDDDDDVRSTSTTLLQTWGHTVHAAANGEEGLQLVQSATPDMVFVDIGMPDLDGYAVARILRKRFQHRPLYLVALTGFGSDRDRVRCQEAGFDEHLLKPVPAATFKATLRRAAESRPAVQAAWSPPDCASSEGGA